VNQKNQYTTFGSDSLNHDASGNLKTKGQTSYQWDVRDRLIGISGSGVTASFSYDALGRRASKTVNGQTLGYQYDGADIIQDSNSQYLQGLGIDDVLSRTTNSNNEYDLKDHLGSTVALADQSGNLATQYGYSPYGLVSKTGTGSNNYFTYTGREDDGTGLYYYRARYYSSDLKRFTAEDPIGFSGGQSNLYAYVGGSPTGNTDSSGLLFDKLIFRNKERLHENLDKAVTAQKFLDSTQNLKTSIDYERGFSDHGDTISGVSRNGVNENIRYVIDPANPTMVIDMRHFFAVGGFGGECYGLLIEYFQWLQGVKGNAENANSAFNPQDLFSNALGDEFVRNYQIPGALQNDGKTTRDRLSQFFRDRSHH
jgi:RHS repeat-associated protein